MTLRERFLRWYTGRQIPCQSCDQPGWYPEDAPRHFPIAPADEIHAAHLKAMAWHRSTTDMLRSLEQAILRLQGIPPPQYAPSPRYSYRRDYHRRPDLAERYDDPLL